MKRTSLLSSRFCDRDYTLSDYHQSCYSFDIDKIAFVHIPKTAGSSIHQFFSSRPLLQLKLVNVTVGGCHRPVSRKCPPGQFRYFTVLRSPVDRVWSYYQMGLHVLAPHHPYSAYAKQGLRFFLHNCWEARDLATRYYSGLLLDEPDDKTYNIAMYNLNCFEAVLDFRQLDIDLLRFTAQLGFQVKFDQIPHLNIFKYPQIDDSDRALILRYNLWDNLMYEKWIAEFTAA